jgi:drug/metabolite transporter (DMT)-like permease
LLSGITYAGVIVCLRVLRGISAGWLTAWNHLLSGMVLLPWVVTLPAPTGPQFVTLFLFGAVQMGLAYWLMAQALHVISPQEAGTLLLLEPILNPVWAYLVAGEQPHAMTYPGGVLILAALAYRYWPNRVEAAPTPR